MSLFRSDRMGYYNIVMPREYAWEVLNEIGELSSLQFVDQNAHETAFNRPYSNYVRRCEDMEAKIKGIESELTRFNIPIERCFDPKAFLHNQKAFLLSRNRAEKTYFDELEGWLDEKLGQLNEQIKNFDGLVDTYNHLVEFRQVLIQTRPYIGDSEFRAQNEGEGGYDIGERPDLISRGNIRFGYLAGVINREDALRFKKILFRVTRGMAWTVIQDISRPKSDPTNYFKEGVQTELKDKSVFLIVYQGGYNDMMKNKLNKVCDSFSASKYGIPEEPGAFNKKLQDIDQQLREAQNVLNITEGQIKNQLNLFAQPRNYTVTYSLIEDLRLFLIKEKTIYHNLNTLKTKNALYQGACWCPVEESEKVRLAINELKRRKSEIGGCDFNEASFPEHVSPPTHFRLNEVTWVFQEIVNTYGVPRYREINPGLFTIATFPFLFGVMFGDIGHGGLLLTFAIYLCWWKEEIEKDKKSMLAGILPARYLLLFQGIFAFYCGLIYNDFMAMPWNLFGSCYDHELAHGETTYSKHELGCTYPIGIDPSWYGVGNELSFLNSFKMKLSIIMGVTQMTFGIFLRGNNNFHFNHWLEFIFEFIPMLLFLSLTFGYMAILIFIKWSLPWGTPGYPISESPSIISIFIKMALSPGVWSKDNGMPLYGDAEGKYQAELQLNFLLIAVVCAILILVPKPLILWIKHITSGSSAPAGYQQQHDEVQLSEKLLGEEDKPKEVVASHGGHGHGHGEFELGEIVVHQVIETIEFVLGAISNTASYLRLWALSLAHSQLAKVFYDNTIGAAIISGNFITAFAGFAFLALCTFSVLLLMDQMECFLHALRLHWVEFQGKFYKADGYKFEPFSFEKNLKEAIVTD